MKIRVLALALAAALLLPGCSAMLNRTYQVVSPHPELPSTVEDSSAIRVETYHELVNAVLYFVEQSVEHGVVRLVNYTRDVETDLNRACLEVAKDDPLGAYAVDFIKHDYTRVVATYEANIYITYRRTAEQMRALVNVTGSSAIRQELGEALNSFAPEVALRVGYFAEDEDYIRSLVRQAYYDTPTAALGMPAFTVSLYPETGNQRIVEIVLTYPEEREILLARQADTLTAAQRLTASYNGLSNPASRLSALLTALPQAMTYAPADGGEAPCTAWDALTQGRADDEGLALAFRLLCGLIGVDCAVTEGRLEGAPRFWNTLSGAAVGEVHVDLSRPESPQLYSNDAFAELGYVWQEDGAADLEPKPSPEETSEAPSAEPPADGGEEAQPPEAKISAENEIPS